MVHFPPSEPQSIESLPFAAITLIHLINRPHISPPSKCGYASGTNISWTSAASFVHFVYNDIPHRIQHRLF